MKKLITFILATAITVNVFSQTVTYTMPDGFEKTISKTDYKTIVDIAVKIVAQRYKIEDVKDGSITIAAKQGLQVFNLDNLLLKCANEHDHAKWEAIIQDHFNSLFNAVDEQKKIDPLNYDKIKTYLSIRIYPDATIAQRGGADNSVSRIDLEGTKTLLMLDLPQAFTSVSKKDFEIWHKSVDEVFKTALENVRQQKIERADKTYDMDGAQIDFTLLGNEDYAASYALDLANNSPDLVGEWGSVVIIPNKGLVLLCKISKAKPIEFVKFIQLIKPIAEQSYTGHQYPVSREFFWYYKGKFTHISVTTDDKGRISVTAPPGLSELMAGK